MAENKDEVGKVKKPHPGSENLRPLNTLPKEEQRAIQSKGGKASMAKLRRRKTLREELVALLSDPEVQERMSLALIREATEGNKAGSVARAWELVRDTIGERPRDQLEVGNLDDKPLATVDLSKMTDDQLRAMLARRQAEDAAEDAGEND